MNQKSTFISNEYSPADPIKVTINDKSVTYPITRQERLVRTALIPWLGVPMIFTTLGPIVTKAGRSRHATSMILDAVALRAIAVSQLFLRYVFLSDARSSLSISYTCERSSMRFFIS